MKRENKYLVIKNADIEKYLTDDQQVIFSACLVRVRVGRLNEGKQDQQYVCVAADWPMYETVWKLVESYVDGTPNEYERLQAENAALKAELAAATKKFEEAITINERLSSDVRCANYELAAAQKDAARYRWLREECRGHFDEAEKETPQLVHAVPLRSGWRDDIDEAIDKELEKAK